MSSPWSYLTRFVDDKGTNAYGDLILPSGRKIEDLEELLKAGELQANILEGRNVFSLSPTGKTAKVSQVLGPLVPDDVPLVRCIGLNYRTHSESSKIASLSA